MPKSTHMKSTGKKMPDDNQADLSRRTSASAHSLHNNQNAAEDTYRCADVGDPDCRWEVSGDSEDEVMHQVEEHWRQDHGGMGDWGAVMRDRVHDSIRRKAA